MAPSRLNSAVAPVATVPRVWRPGPSTVGRVLKVMAVSLHVLLLIRCTVPPGPPALTPRRRRACWTWRPLTPLTANRRELMRVGEAAARRITDELKVFVAEPLSTYV